MGMYDIFGDAGDQLKIFDVPYYCYNEKEYRLSRQMHSNWYFLSRMGGSLKYYNIGDDVPWRAMSYNYGKNFVVIDPGFKKGDELLYVFRDGKVAEQLESEEIKDWEFLDVYYYNKQGVWLNITFKSDICIYINNTHLYWDLKQSVNKKSANLHRVLEKYRIIDRTDEASALYLKATQDLDFIEKTLFNQAIEDNRPEYFYDMDMLGVEFMDYGAYIQLIHEGQYTGDAFESLVLEAKYHIEKYDITPHMFFEWNDTPEEDKEWIIEVDEFVRDYIEQEV